MHPVLISIGPLTLFSYSLFLVIAWCTFSFLFWRSLKDDGVDDERIFNLTFYATLYAFIASRFSYIVLHWNDFSTNLLRTVALWVAPGLTFYGALLAGILTMVLLARRYKLHAGRVLDALAVSLPVAGFFGAIGAFLDGTVVGKVTKLPWAVSYVGHAGARHPAELADAAFYLVLAGVIMFLRKRLFRSQTMQGMLAIWFFILFSLGEFLLEFLKDSSVYWAHLTLNQWILLAVFSETAGMLYVKGGGKEWAARTVKTVLVKIGKSVRKTYERITKRRHADTSEKA